MTTPNCGARHSFRWSDMGLGSKCLKEPVGSRFIRSKVGVFGPGCRDLVGSRLGQMELGDFTLQKKEIGCFCWGLRKFGGCKLGRKENGGSWLSRREVDDSRLRRRELVGPKLGRKELSGFRLWGIS